MERESEYELRVESTDLKVTDGKVEAAEINVVLATRGAQGRLSQGLKQRCDKQVRLSWLVS